MKIKNVTRQDLDAALAEANAQYSGNVTYNRLEQWGKHWQVTLRVKDSKGPGHRLGRPDWQTGKQRRLVSACWHVHGTFFDALPDGAVIVAQGRTIRPGDRWNDWNIGSKMRPMYASEACECE